MRIRRAAPADLDAIMDIHLKGWMLAYDQFLSADQIGEMQPEKRRPVWEKYLADPAALVLVGAVGPEIDGFLLGGPVKEHEITQGSLFGFDCEIYALHCRREVQGQGLGRGLIAAAAAHWRGEGRRALMLWAYADNQWRRFYEKIGGRVVAQGLDDGVPDIAYGWRDLAPLIDQAAARKPATTRFAF